MVDSGVRCVRFFLARSPRSMQSKCFQLQIIGHSQLCRQWRPEIQSGHQSGGFGMESHWATKRKGVVENASCFRFRDIRDTFQADRAGCTTLPEHVHVQHT